MKRKVCLYLLCLTYASPLSAQTAEDYFNSGYQKYENQDYVGSIRDYNKAIQIDPNDAAVYNHRGNSYFDLERYDEAIRDYKKAIQLKPDYAVAYYNRGNGYSGLENFDEAIRDFTKAIQLDPTDADYYNSRGTSYIDLERYDEAIRDFTKAIQLDPTDADYYYFRGGSYSNLERYDEAIRDLTKAIQLDPTDAEFYYGRGYVYDDLERYNEAIRDYNKAIQLDPTDAEYYHSRGYTYGNLERYNEAIQDYNKAILLKPDFALAKSNLEKVKGKLTGKRTPKIWIVAVGIDSYEYPTILTSLDACVSNAFQFEGIFLQSNLVEKDQTEVLPNSRADKEGILNAIKSKLCNSNTVRPEDMVVFYFVGHGTVLDNTSFGICPFDYLTGEQLISESEIVQLMNTSPALHKICLIESCKSKNLVMGASFSPQILESFNNRRKNYPASLVMLTSTKVGEPSIQDRNLGGYFSHYLRAGLKGKADGKGTGVKDGYLSVRELFLFIKENVMRDTKNIQVPQLNKLAYEADIPLIPVIEN